MPTPPGSTPLTSTPLTSTPLGRLLIVDDEVELMTALRDTLVKRGYEVACFSCAEEALAALPTQPFDILLSDLMMPGMDGIELLRAALEVDPHLVGIIMTGHGTIETAVEAMKVGAFDYVLKPFKLQTVLPVLTRAMEVRTLRLENMQLRETVAVTELTKAIAFTPDLNTVLNLAADAAMEQCRADEGSILLPSADGHELYVAAVRGDHREHVLGQRMAIDDGIAGWVAGQREAVILHGTISDSRFAPLQPRSGIYSSIIMPLFAAGKLVGVLNVNATRRHGFAPGEVKAVGMVASVIAPALESAQLQTQLRASEQRYRTLAEAAPDAIFIVDRAGVFKYVNHTAAAALGLTPDEIIGRKTSAFFPPDIAAENERIFAAVVDTGEAHYVEVPMQQGERATWQSTWLVPLHYEAGQTPLVMGVSRDITAQKTTEAALRDSEERFRQVAENINEVFWMSDPTKAAMLYVSPAYERIWGATCQSLYGNPASFLNAIHPDDRERVIAALPHQTRPGGYHLEYRIIRPDGSQRWILDRAFPITNEAGEVYRVTGLAEDITVRKEDEKALQKERDFSSAVVDTAGSLVMVVDRHARIVRFNSSCERLTGYSFEEVRGRKFFELPIAPESQEMVDRVFGGLRPEYFPSQFENIWTAKDGARRAITWSNTALLDETGEVEFVVATGVDITQRKEAEKALQNETDFSTAVVDTVGNLVVVLDREACIVRFNRACEQLSGYSFEEVRGKNIFDITIDLPERATVYEVFRNICAGDYPTQFENYWVTRDGARRLIAWSNTALMDNEGQVQFVIGTGTDITERNRIAEELRASRDELELRVTARTTELSTANRALQNQIAERQMAMGALRETVEQLEQAKQEADRANQAKSEFLSRMSHELRTPMNSILGFAQLMEMQENDDRQVVRIGNILAAGHHLLRLINEVLDIARVDTGLLGLSLEPVSVAACVQQAVSLIRPLCRTDDLTLVNEIDFEPDKYILADQQRLAQVLLNLLSNATKYNREHGTIRISSSEPREGWLRLSVTDTGAGITAEGIARLFQPFERLNPTSTIEGTGLGLALSQRLVEAMDGVMGVDSTPGEGSTFWFELPLTAPGLLGATMPSIISSNFDSLEAAHSILYIEDNLANLEVVTDALSDYPQIRLLSAMQGRMGIDLARQHQPSLILLDVHLPDIQGDEVLAHLKSDPRTAAIPVVVVSADATTNQIRRLLDAGASSYLTKPLDVRAFLAVVNEHLQQDR